MKSFMLLLIYITSFMSMFFILSFIGLLWTNSYSTIIHDGQWFIAYSASIGWWTAAFPAREYYVLNKQYFNYIF